MQVYSYVLTMVKDQASAEEITQNTFYKAMTAKKKYEGRSSEFTWLCSIAKRLTIDGYRRNTKTAELSEAVPSEKDIAKEAEDRNMALQIHLVLHEMPEPYKEVFNLRVFGELSFENIGMIFGHNASWARVTYYRAKAKIQQKLEELSS